MDKMYIRDLRVFANHGVFEEEKRLGQLFIISLELDLNLKAAGRTGDLSKSVHYGELCEKVDAEFTRESFELIESAALNLAEFILAEYPLIQGVKVFLKKPWAPIKKPLETVELRVERSWHKAYIGLGSNMGDTKAYLTEALKQMGAEAHTHITKQSSFITTKPWGYTDQADFLNAVVEVKTYLEPEELMDRLLEIEKELDRTRELRWGPRTIDLDLLMYDNLIMNEEKVILPHPRLHERAFVLESLNEIAPFMIHPVLHKSMMSLLQEVEK